MKKTDNAASELFFLLRMLHALPDAGSIEKMYRMLLAFTISGRTIGFERAMLLLLDTEGGLISGHIGVQWPAGDRQAMKHNSYDTMAKEVFSCYERVDASDLTVKLKTYSVPYNWYRSALVKAARSAFPVLAEGKLSEFATDTFFDYFETKSYLAVPVLVNGQVRAVLAADNALSHTSIDVDDVSLLYSLAQQTGNAIETLIAASENERNFRILIKLEQALQTVESREKVDEALKLSLAMIGKAVAAAGTFIKDALRDRTIHVKSVTGFSLEAEPDDIAVSECFEKILDRAAGSLEPIRGDSNHPLVDNAIAGCISHFYVCPLTGTGEVSGALGIYSEKKDGQPDRKAFSSKNRRFLELCAGIITLKLESLMKQERLHRQEQLVEEIHANLARERERSRIGEQGIEYHRRVEADIRRIRQTFHSKLMAPKRLSRADEILTEIEQNTMRYKAEFTQPDSCFKMIDIFKVVKKIVNRWKQTAKDMDVKVTIRIPSNGPQLLMDEEKITMAIENILKSMASVLRAEDKVMVECATTRDRVRIIFADTGLGLPGNLLSRLFMPFTEIGTGDERRNALSLAGEILHTHAGEIKVKTSLNWKTMLELSFVRMGNKDRRKNGGERRRKSSDRRLPVKSR